MTAHPNAPSGGPALEEIAFLARSSHRVAVLEALAEQPSTRDRLRAATGASSPTVGRILSDLQARRWVAEDERVYELTPLGEYVARRLAELCEAMATERKLRDVWRWLPREMEGFSVELFEDAVVSYPGSGYPYEPVERVNELIDATTRMRGFGSTVFKSITNEAVCEAVLDGMEFEYVYSPDVLETTIAWDPERVAQAARQDNCTILVHEDLPDGDRCGLGIFDDRSGICCHDPDSGMLEAVVDTDAPEAREWAFSVYERHRAQARELEPAEADELFPPGLPA